MTLRSTYLFTRVTVVGYLRRGRLLLYWTWRNDSRERERTLKNISLYTFFYFSAHCSIGKKKDKAASHKAFLFWALPQTANVFMHTSDQIAHGSDIRGTTLLRIHCHARVSGMLPTWLAATVRLMSAVSKFCGYSTRCAQQEQGEARVATSKRIASV